jgi:hypothetical protein
MHLFILPQHVSAAYAGHHQVEIHKIKKEKYTLRWRPPPLELKIKTIHL